MNAVDRHRRSAAFTLIELVTVMVILGLVAAFTGGPTLAYIDSMRSQAAAGRLASDIRYMQGLAVNSGLRTWVVFSTASNNYRLYVEDRANLGKANRVPTVHPLDQSTNAVQFGSGPFANVAISSVNINGTSELEFDTFGVPYDANGIALTANGVVGLSNGASAIVHSVSGMVERG
jgi:prepilin-type N-terminal cleavage/methylation domain-containing protein